MYSRPLIAEKLAPCWLFKSVFPDQAQSLSFAVCVAGGTGGMIGQRDRVIFAESDHLGLRLTVASAELCMTRLHHSDEGKNERHFAVNGHIGCEEVFELEGRTVFEQFGEHGHHILHEGVVVLSE